MQFFNYWCPVKVPTGRNPIIFIEVYRMSHLRRSIKIGIFNVGFTPYAAPSLWGGRGERLHFGAYHLQFSNLSLIIYVYRTAIKKMRKNLNVAITRIRTSTDRPSMILPFISICYTRLRNYSLGTCSIPFISFRYSIIFSLISFACL